MGLTAELITKRVSFGEQLGFPSVRSVGVESADTEKKTGLCSYEADSSKLECLLPYFSHYTSSSLFSVSTGGTSVDYDSFLHPANILLSIKLSYTHPKRPKARSWEASKLYHYSSIYHLFHFLKHGTLFYSAQDEEVPGNYFLTPAAL